ncbi:MAG: ABC transporter [Rhizobiales bacterium 24-66-13]|jgi:cholesterol transport system auxiliary component|nr:MAG: ABC transporter [Rhizobiales bacterium 24-66-13]
MIREPRVSKLSLSPRLPVRPLLALMAALALAACASAPVPTFDLSAPGNFTARGAGSGQMVVPIPTALAALDTEKILVEPAPGQITYLADAQWGDRLPALLQARMIQAFENGSKLRRVARPGDGITAEYQLNIDIRTFGVRVENGTSTAVVELSAKIIGNAAGRILAAQVFSARVPVATVNGATVAAALDAASNQVLVEIVRWASVRF